MMILIINQPWIYHHNTIAKEPEVMVLFVGIGPYESGLTVPFDCAKCPYPQALDLSTWPDTNVGTGIVGIDNDPTIKLLASPYGSHVPSKRKRHSDASKK